MKIGKLNIGKRSVFTKDFKWMYCPLGKGFGRENYRFFFWFGRKWYICLWK